MKKIITISREFGAGGGTIGRAVAQKLGFEYFDKDIIITAARSVNMATEKVVEFDEKAPALSGFTQALFDFYNKPVNEQLYEAQKKVIREFGEKGNCVIVGRNANSILSEYDNALHVFIHADEYWRLQNMKKKMADYSESKILQKLSSVDKSRRKFCSYFTDTEFGDASAYDICLSTSKLGIDECVRIICDLAGK